MQEEEKGSMMPGPLKSPKYQEFTCIARTMHDEDVFGCVTEGRLKHSFTIENLGINILWFGVPKPPDIHDWYGNIRFQIDFNVLREFYKKSWRCYYMDRIDYYSSSVSRILITRKTIRIPDFSIPLKNFSFKGFPIWENSSGQLYHVTKSNGIPHTVEFMIDATKDVAEFLFRNCARIPVNHSKANSVGVDNKFISSICHKYNKFGNLCPTNTTAKKTRSRIKKLIPGLFEFNTIHEDFVEEMIYLMAELIMFEEHFNINNVIDSY